MDMFWIVVLTIVVVVVSIALAKKRTSDIDIIAFTTAVMEAADAGEKAYTNQVNLISSRRGQQIETSPRGLALARLLCASFPAAAYGVIDAGNGLVPSVTKNAPFAGKEVFNFASGAAIKPLGITPSHPEYAKIKEDANNAVRDYISFFNDHFKANPVENLAAAEAYLAPHWQKALEISLGPTERNLHTTQFCTSGLHLFIVWFQALSK